MKNIIFKIITAMLVTNVLAAGEAQLTTVVGFLSEQNGQVVMNGPSEEYQALSIDQDSWKLYEQKVGNHSFLVALPHKNELFARVNDDMTTVVSVNNDVEYWVMAPLADAQNVQAEELFPRYLEQHSQFPYEMLSHEVTVEDNHQVLKMMTKNQKTGKIEESKITVSGSTFYVATMKYPQGQEQNNRFLQSFALLN